MWNLGDIDVRAIGPTPGRSKQVSKVNYSTSDAQHIYISGFLEK